MPVSRKKKKKKKSTYPGASPTPCKERISTKKEKKKNCPTLLCTLSAEAKKSDARYCSKKTKITEKKKRAAFDKNWTRERGEGFGLDGS